jgi:hypothetical protein
MDGQDPRAVLERLMAERGEDCASLSRLIGRNDAYVQQFIRRGSPRRLAEADRATLARYFGVPESWLGGRVPAATAALPALVTVPVFDTAASAGPGAVGEDRLSTAGMGFSEGWLQQLRPGRSDARDLSVIRVTGRSMEPTLQDRDEILVDTGDRRLREGIWVLRIEDVVLVKRLRRGPGGLEVVSDNPEAGPVDLAGGYALIGRVLWAGRKL